MTVIEAEMIRNAKKPFEYNVSEGEDVLIVSDTAMDRTVWSVLNKAARSLDIKPSLCMMAERDRSYQEPPLPVREAMLAADVILMPTSKGLLHSETGIEANHQGTKMIPMSEIRAETLAGGAADADYEAIYEQNKRIKEVWDRGERVEVSAPAGTELRADISDRRATNCSAHCDRTGEKLVNPDAGAAENAGRVAAFPDGEVPIAPNEGTTNGTIVWDTSMHEVGLIDTPIKATVEDGYVTDIEGGREATKIREFLSDFDNEAVYNIAELSIGTNPGAEITGHLREDKKAWGYMHIAVGANIDFGGTVSAPTHIDGTVSGPTLTIDDQTIVEDGEIIV